MSNVVKFPERRPIHRGGLGELRDQRERLEAVLWEQMTMSPLRGRLMVSCVLRAVIDVIEADGLSVKDAKRYIQKSLDQIGDA